MNEVGSFLDEHVDTPAVGTQEHGMGHAAVIPVRTLGETASAWLPILTKPRPHDLGLEHLIGEPINLLLRVIAGCRQKNHHCIHNF